MYNKLFGLDEKIPIVFNGIITDIGSRFYDEENPIVKLKLFLERELEIEFNTGAHVVEDCKVRFKVNKILSFKFDNVVRTLDSNICIKKKWNNLSTEIILDDLVVSHEFYKNNVHYFVKLILSTDEFDSLLKYGAGKISVNKRNGMMSTKLVTVQPLKAPDMKVFF